VKDPKSGGTYWWNTQTNQVTHIGAPKPSVLTPEQQQQNLQNQSPGSRMGGLMGAVADGMAWGVGSAVMHRAMDGILGPRQMEVVHRDETSGGGMDGGAGGAGPPPPDPSSGGDGGGGWFGGGGGDNYSGREESGSDSGWFSDEGGWFDE